jgi:hypothetical protein
MLFSVFCGRRLDPKAIMPPVIRVIATTPIRSGLWKILLLGDGADSGTG